MTYYFYQRLQSIIIIALLLFSLGCSEIWEEHYDESETNLPDYALFEYVESNAELDLFKQMLELTGYDSILNASQTYTVWAPNNPALNGIDITDLELVDEIVKNHIARGNYSTSGNRTDFVKMLNGKYVQLSGEGTDFTFGSVKIIEANNKTINGLVHITEGYVPYRNNLWEFIGDTENLDSVENYLYGLNQLIFDPEASVEIGYDSIGNALYDSVFIYSNPVLTNLGAFNVEDSTYSIIVPDNMAWTEAYGRINGYYNIPDVFGGASRKQALTQWTLIQDMAYRGLVTNPDLLPTITSTNGNTFYSPSDLFNGTNPNILSNGLAYVTSQMPFTDTASWYKPIKVEAETDEGRTNANGNIYLRIGQGDNYEISNDRYILVEPTSTSDLAQANVVFQIPNTLSAEYDIYCVFVPASISDPTNLRSNKATFTLTYISTTGGRTRRTTFTPDNNSTNPNGLTRMLVTRFNFDFANVVDEEYPTTAVTLQVTNAVTVAEENAGNFSRTMRIDCIILEPVIE